MTETLDRTPAGARVVIDAVDGPLGTRLAELGLLPGAEVEVRNGGQPYYRYLIAAE